MMLICDSFLCTVILVFVGELIYFYMTYCLVSKFIYYNVKFCTTVCVSTTCDLIYLRCSACIAVIRTQICIC